MLICICPTKVPSPVSTLSHYIYMYMFLCYGGGILGGDILPISIDIAYSRIVTKAIYTSARIYL